MFTDEVIDVECVLYTSDYSIRNKLPKLLAQHKVLSFDTETRSLYDAKEREEAKQYAKKSDSRDPLNKQALVVEASSGLSYPSIVKTTHFIFGESNKKSHVVVCTSAEQEMFLWNLVADYEGLWLVHNSLFDLKIMYQRVGKLPKNFIDTALLAKCLTNHVDIWKCKTGLKGLVGAYYDPNWSLMNDYEPVNLKDPKFIDYCAVDGAATFYLYELIQEELRENLDEETD